MIYLSFGNNNNVRPDFSRLNVNRELIDELGLSLMHTPRCKRTSPEPKTEKGYISLGMSQMMSRRISFFELTNEIWVREKFSTNEELHNPTPIPRISF